MGNAEARAVSGYYRVSKGIAEWDIVLELYRDSSFRISTVSDFTGCNTTTIIFLYGNAVSTDSSIILNDTLYHTSIILKRRNDILEVTAGFEWLKHREFVIAGPNYRDDDNEYGDKGRWQHGIKYYDSLNSLLPPDPKGVNKRITHGSYIATHDWPMTYEGTTLKMDIDENRHVYVCSIAGKIISRGNYSIRGSYILFKDEETGRQYFGIISDMQHFSILYMPFIDGYDFRFLS